ncbi:serine protease Do-like HtrB [Paraliobacillus ryukyuensis]|uniref:Serine protease Do n=1 Tax=Paraliobacillus ryukyuensis TaxID=200904 RepID=A0A366EDS8_9BACI|nr:trypsin-like peptidase domain-containing protein [Paraliobacillus ryukyuensis]RBO99899.1 serine protease Do [Paraliobacillus ryukyuensis]
MSFDVQDENNRTKTTERHKRAWLVPTMLGIMLGAVVVAAILPSLIRNGILPYQIVLPEAAYQGNKAGDTNMSSLLQPISVDISTQLTDIIDDVAPAVVGVENVPATSIFSDETPNQSATGSGVIYKVNNEKAYIVTNHHVVDGAADIEVILADDRRLTATLLGSDLFMDLAVLEVEASNIDHVMTLGDSEQVKVGEPAIAIGNPLGLDLSGSVTQGIISGKQRAIPQDFNQDGRADWQAEVIQTDAAINPGNSGGALVNMQGQLIGINSMKIAQSAVEGIGFAIPIDVAMPVVDQLEKHGSVSRAFLGVEAYSLEDVAQAEWERSLHLPQEVTGGIYLQSVEPMSPASSAGLEVYDVITALDGKPIMNIIDLRKHLYQQKQPGDKMVLTLYRDGKKQEVTVELSEQQP